jgi:2-dehydro-3-deoxyphosphogluconate aldolase/(4S)-4-hydroxy-2-oxoglutarate aldolase
VNASQLWLAQPPLIRLQQAGLIAILSGNFSLTEIIEIGDALLAAPVLALEIDLANRYANEAIADLRQRAGPHLLIGAGGVQTVAQAELALTAGAQFITTATFDSDLAAHSRQNHYLLVPGVSTLAEAEQAQTTGCSLVKVDGSPERLAKFRQALPELDFIAAGDITLANIAAYVQAGAVSVAVGRTLITEPYTSMAAVISTARALQGAWAEAQSRRGEA